MIEAFQEQLITIDELRARMPDLRARESQPAQPDRRPGRPARRPRGLPQARRRPGRLPRPTPHQRRAPPASHERQRVLRLLVKDVLIGPEKITIRHRIPVREHATDHSQHHDHSTDTEGDHRPSCPLRWGRGLTPAGQHLPVPAGHICRDSTDARAHRGSSGRPTPSTSKRPSRWHGPANAATEPWCGYCVNNSVACRVEIHTILTTGAEIRPIR